MSKGDGLDPFRPATQEQLAQRRRREALTSWWSSGDWRDRWWFYGIFLTVTCFPLYGFGLFGLGGLLPRLASAVVVCLVLVFWLTVLLRRGQRQRHRTHRQP